MMAGDKIYNNAIIILTLLLLLFSVSYAEESPANEPDKKAKKGEELKKGPKMEHEGTLPGELCVICHMETKEPDPESISPKIDNTHKGCDNCHKEDGVVEGHCGCEDAKDPMDCAQCHTEVTEEGTPNAKDMNDLCLKCH